MIFHFKTLQCFFPPIICPYSKHLILHKKRIVAAMIILNLVKSAFENVSLSQQHLMPDQVVIYTILYLNICWLALQLSPWKIHIKLKLWDKLVHQSTYSIPKTNLTISVTLKF